MRRECHRVRAACPHEHGDQISGESLTKACELLCRCRNVFMRSRHVRERCLPGRQKVLERLLNKVATAPGAERSIHPFGKRPCRMRSFWCGRECIWPSVESITRACSLPASGSGAPAAKTWSISLASGFTQPTAASGRQPHGYCASQHTVHTRRFAHPPHSSPALSRLCRPLPVPSFFFRRHDRRGGEGIH